MTDAIPMSMAEYVRERRIKVEVTSGPKLTVEDGWEHNAYRVRLTSPTMDRAWSNVPWKQGTAVKKDPALNPEMVFDALVSDAAGADGARGFEDFCAEYGYDTDSRKAEKLYRDCLKVRDRLIAFLGSREEFEKVAYEVERL